MLLGYALVVAYLSLSPNDTVPVDSADKPAHFAAYALFAVLAFVAVGHGRALIYLSLAIALYSGLLEIAQSFVPGRVMSLADMGANLLGVLAGSLLCTRYRR